MKKLERAAYITGLYEKSTATSLSDVYGRYSAKKAEAFNYCRKLMYEYSGKNLRILTYNTFIFTAAFEFVDPETSQVMIMYITPSKNEVLEWTILAMRNS